MEEERVIPLSDKDTETESPRKIYWSGFVTGALTAALAICLAALGPKIYDRYINGNIDSKTKAETIYNIMKTHYIDEIDESEMYEGIYIGMTSLPTDRYSYYMGSEEAESYNEKTDGNYVGIGIVITANDSDQVEIRTVYNPSPAHDAGVKKGDILVNVSGVDITSANMDEAVSLVRGPENTTVDYTVYRPSEDKTYDFTSCRKAVDVNTVFWRMLDDETGYIQLTAFDGVTSEQYNTAVKELQDKGMKKMIIDLRGNPGGLLTTVTDITDTLIPEGTLTYTEDNKGKKSYIYTDDEYLGLPLAVIVNGSSASASELLSGAVKDTGSGTIVGETTFGKGVVQTTFPLRDGSIVKLTTARYYTPNGTCIDGIGITPDIEVAAAEGFVMPDLADEDAVIDIEADLQLKAAIEALK